MLYKNDVGGREKLAPPVELIQVFGVLFKKTSSAGANRLQSRQG
jgi:hypothetical protein